MAASGAFTPSPLQVRRCRLTTPLVPVALFIYDTFISFDREVTCFWTAQRTSASFLFFANKWISMILYITALVDFAYFSSDKVSHYIAVSV